MSIQTKIKQARVKAGLRQADLAKQLDVSSNYIAQLESGRKLAPIRLLDKLSDVLDIKLSDLLEEDKIVLKIREELRAEFEQLYISSNSEFLS